MYEFCEKLGFALTSSVQQDLSEFLLPDQQDLLTVVASAPNHEFDNEPFNLAPIVANSSTHNNLVTGGSRLQDNSQDLQDLTFQNLEQLDNFLVNPVTR